MRPTEIDKVAVAQALYRLRRAGRLPPLWIDADIIQIETVPGVRKRLDWPAAARLAAGQPLDSATRRPRRKSRPNAWQARRRAYLRAVRRHEAP